MIHFLTGPKPIGDRVLAGASGTAARGCTLSPRARMAALVALSASAARSSPVAVLSTAISIRSFRALHDIDCH
jgi:hypothetical protein